MLALCLPTTLSYAAAAVVDVRPPPNALGKAVNGVPIAGQVIISLPTYKPSTATAQTSHQKDSEPSESIISGQTNRRATVVASATSSGEVDLGMLVVASARANVVAHSLALVFGKLICNYMYAAK